MVSQVQHGLDEFEFHEEKSVVVDDAIHARVEGGINGLGGAGCTGKNLSWRIGQARSSSEIVLHAEVSAFRALEDGMAECTAEEHERPFAFRNDGVHEFLQHDARATAEI